MEAKTLVTIPVNTFGQTWKPRVSFPCGFVRVNNSTFKEIPSFPYIDK